MIRNKFALAIVAGMILAPVLFISLMYGDIQQIQAAGYSTIKQGSNSYTPRTVLNFLSNMTCADNSGATPPETDCTPSGGGGSTYYQTVQQAGSSLPQEPILNFTSGVTCADSSGTTSTNCSAAVATLGPPYLTVGGNRYGTIFGPLTPPSATSFTWVNQGSATVTAQNGSIFLALPGENAGPLRGQTTALPSPPYTVTLGFIPTIYDGTSSAETLLCLTDGTLLQCQYYAMGAQNGQAFSNGFNNWNSASSFNGPFGNVNQISGDLIFFRVQDTGTNRIWSFSRDGTNFLAYAANTVSDTNFVTPTAAGFFGVVSNGNYSMGTVIADWVITTP